MGGGEDSLILLVAGLASMFIGVLIFCEIGQSHPVNSELLSEGTAYQIVCANPKDPGNLVVLTRINGKTKLYKFSEPIRLPNGSVVRKEIKDDQVILVPLPLE